MKKRHALALVCTLLLVPAGCSPETVEEAEQAGGAAGEALEGAAKDTAANIEEAAQAVDEAIEVDEGEPDAAAGENADGAPAGGEGETP